MRAAWWAAAIACAATPAHATLFFTGRLTCAGLPGIDGGPVPVLIVQRGYRAEYSLSFAGSGAGPAGLHDRGRGNLFGLDLTMQGGGSAAGYRTETRVAATRSNRNYRIQVRQSLGAHGAPPQMRVCRGSASLGIP